MFYIIGNDGNVHGENQNREHLQHYLDILLDQDEYKDLELEIIDDTDTEE